MSVKFANAYKNIMGCINAPLLVSSELLSSPTDSCIGRFCRSLSSRFCSASANWLAKEVCYKDALRVGQVDECNHETRSRKPPQDVSKLPAKSFSFGPFALDADERILSREGLPIQISHRAFDTLLQLVDRAPHLISKSALMNAVWAESFVEETNLTVVISVLWKSLGDDGQERKYIQTVPKLGYRFIADVKRNAIRKSPAD